MIFLAIINILAVCVIAYYAFESHRLANDLTEINEKHQQELRDLYQAIVIATILSGPSGTGAVDKAIKIFKQHYSGEAAIFQKE